MYLKTKLLLIAVISVFAFAGCEKEFNPNDPGALVPKTVDQDASLPSISVNGTMLHAETYGNPDSAMIIVLHGGPGSDYRYLLNCKELANNGYFVVFYDQRGSGLSKRYPKETYTMQIMYDDLSAVIAHYRKSTSQKVFLLGHSWGGMLATAYINTYPKTINGAILAEPGGFVWQDVLDYVGRANKFKIASETFSDVLYSDQFITAKNDEQAILDYKYIQLLATDDAAGSPIGNEGPLPFWRPGSVIFNTLFEFGNKEYPNWTNNLLQYNTKVLFVYSERNKAYGLEHAKKVSSPYPNVQLLKIDGAGHDMLSFPTGWQNFYPIALNYLNSLK